MAAGTRAGAAVDRQMGQIDNIARMVFEPQLKVLGLDADSINRQSVSELETSLEKVNDAISHVDSFEKLKFNMSASGGVVMVQSTSTWTFERTILPFLLERKSIIIDRIKALRPVQQLDEIRSDVEDKVDDPAARDELIDIINRRFEEERSAQESLNRQQAQVHIDHVQALERERFQMEMRERKWAIYRSFLERESMASVVGTLLLMCLGAALIIATFTHTIVPEIVSSAFLLILGYFFGQTSAREQVAKPSGSDK